MNGVCTLLTADLHSTAFLNLTRMGTGAEPAQCLCRGPEIAAWGCDLTAGPIWVPKQEGLWSAGRDLRVEFYDVLYWLQQGYRVQPWRLAQSTRDFLLWSPVHTKDPALKPGFRKAFIFLANGYDRHPLGFLKMLDQSRLFFPTCLSYCGI